MNAPRIVWPLAESSWGAEEIAAVIGVLSSERITMGARVAEFERAFAERLGARYAVMVNSGSSANLLAVAALSNLAQHPLRRDDEAIVPALAWATTYAPLEQYGLRLRVIDVNLNTLNADFDSFTAALTPSTALVVAVNILGNPCAALPELRRLCDEQGVYLLEDNCESLGAQLLNRPAGTFGHVGTFSFFFSHQLSTGEGGMLVTDDREIADLARCLRAHGWARDLAPDSPLLDRFGRGNTDFAEAYRFLLPGYNLRPTEIAAAVGLAQLAKLDTMIAARRENAARFRAAFAGDSRFILQEETGDASWFGFTMILDNAWALLSRRAKAFSAMRAAGIEFRPITGGSFMQHPVRNNYCWGTECPTAFTAADYLHTYGWFVGNHARDLSAEIAILKRTLDEALQ